MPFKMLIIPKLFIEYDKYRIFNRKLIGKKHHSVHFESRLGYFLDLILINVTFIAEK